MLSHDIFKSVKIHHGLPAALMENISSCLTKDRKRTQELDET